MTSEAALLKVFEILGSKAAVARELRISVQAVSQWKVAPAERAMQLAQLTAQRVSVHELRPDVFGKPAEMARG
jgi:DNA-binding transcriptional regulator YdaS (Cro superfamily)